MYILVTNDDGIDAPGLLALKHAMQRLGDVVVVAPDHNWSGAGHTKTLNKPLRIEKKTLSDGSSGWATDGAPTDCVAVVLLGFLPEKPALIASGINPAGNLAHDLTYSGTVAAAMEGAINNIPSIAVSLDADHNQNFDLKVAGEIAAQIAARALSKGLPPDTFLNVNVPAVSSTEIKGLRITHLGKRIYRDTLIERQDPSGKNYYWIDGDPPSGVIEAGSDIWAVANNYVSVTPVHMDMTSHRLIESLRPWETDLRW